MPRAVSVSSDATLSQQPQHLCAAATSTDTILSPLFLPLTAAPSYYCRYYYHRHDDRRYSYRLYSPPAATPPPPGKTCRSAASDALAAAASALLAFSTSPTCLAASLPRVAISALSSLIWSLSSPFLPKLRKKVFSSCSSVLGSQQQPTR